MKVLKKLTIVSMNGNNVVAHELVECKGVTYKLHCNLSNSMTMGFNVDLCVQMFNKKRGWIGIIDNRELGISKNFEGDKSALINCFTQFKEYIKLINQDNS